MLVHTIASRQIVSAMNLAAFRIGIRPGMGLADARALDAGLAWHVHDLPADTRALFALARWMTRFSSVIQPLLPDPAAGIRGHFILMEVGGSERLFGGPGAITRLLASALSRLGLHARIALAPTIGAAVAVAQFHPSRITLVQPEQLNATLAPLPIESLRLNPDTARRLHRVGIQTVAQLLRIPRTQLPARFGPELVRRLDQATGQLDELPTPLTHDVPIRQTIEFDSPVEDLEPIYQVVGELLDQTLAHLNRRGRGVREMKLQLRCPYAGQFEQTIAVAAPSRDRKNLMNLLRHAVDAIQADEGFTRFSLDISLHESLPDAQHSIVEPEIDTQPQWMFLLERLRLRMGPLAVRAAAVRESHLPERAVEWTTPDAGPRRKITSQPIAFSPTTITPQEDEPHLSRSIGLMTITSNQANRDTHPPVSARPLMLLETPAEIAVIVSPSQDREGRPIAFTHDRQHHLIAHARGPERIAGVWWTAHDKTRDYFDIQTTLGQRLWIFRVLETWRWYLHGWFG